ncbi:autotransporter assembly complex family protein [Pseudoruegeria sp. HB172150]|uniref:autotransporter assembly complex protein TamA n=1 Tax=Pseudoruegeria sp. HB172150 TaxID=2721164 RepID=UPI001551658E|nr:BamA/TamA family outer membrane protein [Pseudoruegeria sp. HB172150]
MTSGVASALDEVQFGLVGNNKDLRSTLSDASLVVDARRSGQTATSEIFAAALSDYARLLDALYAEGYYGGVISIKVDGREAADIPLLRTPASISTVRIVVDPGPRFRFGDARVGPLAQGTELPEGFRSGEPALAPLVQSSTQTAGDAWRSAGYAKVDVAGERITADHRTSTLDAVVGLEPGPVVYFGKLVQRTESRVRASAIKRIAGLPEGEKFSPEVAERVAERLRRTGAFASVTLREAEELGPGNSMDMYLNVVDAKRRRLGVGAEFSSLEGLTLTSFWLHRNIFGGAERLRFDAEISNLGGSYGTDYFLGGRLDVPAVIGAETNAFVYGEIEHLDEPTYLSNRVEFGVGLARRFGDRIETEIALAYTYSETEDDLGDRTFSYLSLPMKASYDTRDNALDATEGFYVQIEPTPFFGLSDDSGSGLKTYADARAYYGFGEDNRVVLAGRLQFGSITGAEISEIHPDYLFFSGGSGTVRGQPYQSLTVTTNGVESGGRSFLGLSAEVRTRITDNIGAVVFADAGYIGAEDFYDGSGEWHSGAGLGVRYLAGFGPIRLDVAFPVDGDTGEGVQVYVGIGQAF